MSGWIVVGRSRRTWGLLTAATLVLSGLAMAPPETHAALVICKKKKQIFLRENTCRTREQQIAASELGVVGPAGQNGQNGTNGTNGTNGAPGTARAYAQMDAAGTPQFVVTRTKNFTGFTRPNTGVYCLTIDPALALDPQTVAAVATVVFGNTVGITTPIVEVRGAAASSCPAGNFAVHTFDGTTASNAVSFMLVVP
jgi:hypothetical protein